MPTSKPPGRRAPGGRQRFAAEHVWAVPDWHAVAPDTARALLVEAPRRRVIFSGGQADAFSEEVITALRVFSVRIVLVAVVLIIPIAFIAVGQINDLNRTASLLRIERGGVRCLIRGYAVLRSIDSLEIAASPKATSAIRSAQAAFAATDCPELERFTRILGVDLETPRSRYAIARRINAGIHAISDHTNLSYDTSNVASAANDAAAFALVDALPHLAFAASATDRIDVAEAEAQAASRLAILKIDVDDLLGSAVWARNTLRPRQERQLASVKRYFGVLDTWEKQPWRARPPLVIPLQATLRALDELFPMLTDVLDRSVETQLEQIDRQRTFVTVTAVAVLGFALATVWLVAHNLLRKHHREIRRLQLLAVKEARFQAIFADSPLPMAITDLDGGVFECNEAYLAFVGIRSRQAERLMLFAPTLPSLLDAGHLLGPLREKAAPSTHVELTLSRSEASPLWCRATATLVQAPGENTDYCAVMLEDFTERQLQEHRLHHDATHDALTGIANRPHLIAQLERHLEQPRDAPRFALLFIDVDDFKTINDTLGHAAGDACLATIAERLRLHVRPGDLVARYGGDEFAILFRDRISIDDVETTAARLRRELAAPIEFGEATLAVSSSIGLATDGDGTQDAYGIVAAADRAMYVDKSRATSRAATIQLGAAKETILRSA